MSCYFRHIQDLFKEAGIIVNPGNKKQIDRAIHQIIGITYKDCSTVWKALKQELQAGEQKRKELIQQLKANL
jgi:hypothetical protein